MKALIFDLDGTLIDSVYPHTLAWQRALAEARLDVPAWEIQRHIGISGKLLARTLARRRGKTFSAAKLVALEKRHSQLFRRFADSCRPLPGAKYLLQFLRSHHIAHGIATTGKRNEIQPSLEALALGPDTIVIDGTSTGEAKPEPDLFVECQKQLGVERSDCLVVGDATWDVHAARRAGILSIGLLTGGFGEQELYNAGAMRVYRDALDLLDSIDELGLNL